MTLVKTKRERVNPIEKVDVKVSLTFGSKLRPLLTYLYVEKLIARFKSLTPSKFAIATPAPNGML